MGTYFEYKQFSLNILHISQISINENTHCIMTRRYSNIYFCHVLFTQSITKIYFHTSNFFTVTKKTIVIYKCTCFCECVCVCVCVCWSTQAAITKYNRLGGLNNRNLFFRNSQGWEIQDQSISFILKPLLLAYRWLTFF